MTQHPTSCSLHTQAASPAWYATSSLLLWQPLPASGHARVSVCLCYHLSCRQLFCRAIDQK